MEIMGILLVLGWGFDILGLSVKTNIITGGINENTEPGEQRERFFSAPGFLLPKGQKDEKMKRILFLVVCCILVQLANAVQYEVTDLGRSGGGIAYSINNAGQVVGTIGLWEDGNITPIGPVGSICYAINNLGQVTGSAGGIAFIWDKNNDLRTLIGSAIGYDINDSGMVVGLSGDGPFIWDDVHGTRTLGGYGAAYDVNNSNEVVGYYFSSTAISFIWDETNGLRYLNPGTGDLAYAHIRAYGINDLELPQVVGKLNDFAFIWDEVNGFGELGKLNPDDRSSEARSIKDNGDIVGFVQDFYGFNHAVLFDSTCGGNNIDLNDCIATSLGWELEIAYDINDFGQIVGTGSLNGEHDHAFLLTPIPEPFTVCLLGLGGLVLVRKQSM